MVRRTRIMLTPEGKILKLRPVFRLAQSYVVCIPTEWIKSWLNTEDMWVAEEDLGGEPGMYIRPYVKPLSTPVETLPLGI